MNKILEVNGLNKSYGTVRAVKDLSFTVQKGEIFGILGPNGAGKSSSLEYILGTRKKDSGNVRILDMDPVQERKKLYARVGVQFQDSSWQTGIRVDEICRSTACLYNPEPDWLTVLDQFDLAKRIKARVDTLSGGERQKLSLLLAFMHKPVLLFLDELTTGLDPVARRDVWKFIKVLRDEGATIILSSHYMDEVETLCDRALMLKDGSCIAAGTIAELVANGQGRNLDESYINLMGA